MRRVLFFGLLCVYGGIFCAAHVDTELKTFFCKKAQVYNGGGQLLAFFWNCVTDLFFLLPWDVFLNILIRDEVLRSDWKDKMDVDELFIALEQVRSPLDSSVNAKKNLIH